MSENSDDDKVKSLAINWQNQASPSNVLRDDRAPREFHENVMWYRLGGKAHDLMLKEYGGRENRHKLLPENKDNPLQVITLDELKEILGMGFGVVREDVRHGRTAHAPTAYASPFPDETDVFYLMCPIGESRKDEQEHFVPEDSIRISETDGDQLWSTLRFVGKAYSPLIYVEPASISPTEQIEHDVQNNLERF